MGMNRNPHVYSDVKAVFDVALNRGYARYRLNTPGKAQHWMQRAYFYRRLLYDLEREKTGLIPGHAPSTPYDQLSMRKEGQEVVVYSREESVGQILDEEGRPIKPEAEPILKGDELEVARRVARDLDLDMEE